MEDIVCRGLGEIHFKSGMEIVTCKEAHTLLHHKIIQPRFKVVTRADEV